MREFAVSMAKSYIASLLVEWAIHTKDLLDLEVASRFIKGGIYLVPEGDNMDDMWLLNKTLGMDVDPQNGKARGVGDVDSRGKFRAKY